MTRDTHHIGRYLITVWGGGVAVAIAAGGLSLYLQGDEAADMLQRLDEAGYTARELDRIWDEYGLVLVAENHGDDA